MSIKINSFEIENVKRIKAVKLEPSANGLTVIGGKNNQGKTSLEDLLADMYLSSIKCVSTEVYELETDDSGYAAIPFTLEENQRSYVFINGLFAVEGKDYQIADNNIQLMSSEFVSNNDVVTFVVIKSMIDGKTGESREINVSSEIYEVTTNTEG